MSSTTLTTTDILPSSVPKLLPTGLNWTAFSIRFKEAIEAKGFWGHFDGTSPKPTASSPATEDEAKALDQWLRDERSAKALLTHRIPDSTLIRIHSKESLVDRWNLIVSEYTQKGAFAQAELRSRFMDSKCPDKGNVREFLDDLRVEKEKLATYGVVIEDKDYRSTIISSLPIFLSNFASSILANARILATSGTVDPDQLISLISKEYDRNVSVRSRCTGKPSKNDDKDEAMAASSSGKGKKDRKPRGVCWNCGDKGHYKDKCTKPAKDTKNDSPKKSGSANAAVEENSEDESAFFVECGDYRDGADWFTEVDESDMGSVQVTEELSEAEVDERDSSFSVDSDSEELNLEEKAVNVDDYAIINHEPHIEIYDSGCTKHITPYRNSITSFVKIPPKSFRAANKQSFKAIGTGEMMIDVPNGTNISQLRLTDVLYAPEIGYTLVSIGRLDDKGYTVYFSDGKCVIKDPNGECIGTIPKDSNGLYKVTHREDKVAHEEDEAHEVHEVLTLDQFHRRMGHISFEVARKLVDKGFVTGVRLEATSGEPPFCESCVYAKATRKPVAKVREGNRATEFGGEIHSDLWGPAPVATRTGKRYYITFTDDKTRLTHLTLLRNKNDAFQSYKDYEAWCDTHLSARIKVLHSDRGGEYLGKYFDEYLKTKGTMQKLTVHDTPQHNGVAERRNRTIVERIRALLHSSGLPKTFWGEAARHVVWLMNRTSTKAVEGMTPFEAVFGKKPDLRHVREWGERVWVRIEGGNKLGGRVKEGRWLGIDERSKGFRILWPDTKTVTTERNVYHDKTCSSACRLEGEDWEFVKTTPDLPPIVKNPTPTEPTVQPAVPSPYPSRTPSPAPSKPPIDNPRDPTTSRRLRVPSRLVRDLLEGRGTTSARPSDPAVATGIQLPPLVENDPEHILEGEGMSDWIMNIDVIDEYSLVAEISDFEALEPRSLAEAKRRPDWELWEKAIHEELALLQQAGTWELTVAPKGANIVGSKWVFRAKKDAAGAVIRHKARLVAQGFSQVPGVDYFDTFAPVAKLASIRAVLAMAAAEDMELHQIDIKGAYLNGELTERETIYMSQPPGYHAPDSVGQVCRLKKTLYGLKQSGRRWYQKLVEIMTKLGLARCSVDQAVFFRRETRKLIIVLVHVDDCTIAATSILLINNFKSEITKHVEITDLGELHWLLGIEIKRNRENRTIHLSQRSYIDSILRRFNFQDLKPVSTPMETHVKLSTSQSPATTAQFAQMRDIPYHEAVGSLMYASLGTRPDISFAVQTLSRFSTKPGIAHWDAVKRVFRYLKGTIDLWLSFGQKQADLTGYADADGSMAEDRHAISGYAFIINGGAVSWSAKRQEIVSLSTTESEYIAATHASKEALWLRSLIQQLFDIKLSPTTLYSDNQSAIALTKDHQYHARTKHIDIRYHFIRWIVEQGSIRLIYCPTDDMVADSLTKALPSAKVKYFAAELGLAVP